MKANVGNVDRLVRLVLGVAIIAAGLEFQSWLGLIGVVLVGTAAVKTCPLYLPFGLSTRAVRARVHIHS